MNQLLCTKTSVELLFSKCLKYDAYTCRRVNDYCLLLSRPFNKGRYQARLPT